MKFENQELRDQTLQLCNNEYVDCHIENCKLIYDGSGPVVLERNAILSCEMSLAGAALTTVDFLRHFYRREGDMREFVKKVIKYIRG